MSNPANEGTDLSKCPNCGGPADNGHDRCLPPSPYWCTKCTAAENRGGYVAGTDQHHCHGQCEPPSMDEGDMAANLAAPSTDAAQAAAHLADDPSAEVRVLRETVKQLRRERDEARRLTVAHGIKVADLDEQLSAARRERDEARERAEALFNYSGHSMFCVVRTDQPGECDCGFAEVHRAAIDAARGRE